MHGRSVCGSITIFLALASVVLVGVGNVYLRDLESHDNSRQHRVVIDLANVVGTTPADKWALTIKTGVFNHQQVHYRLAKKSTDTACIEGTVNGPTDIADMRRLFEHMAWVTAPNIPSSVSTGNLFHLNPDTSSATTIGAAAASGVEAIVNASVTVSPTPLLNISVASKCTGDDAPSSHQLSRAMVHAMAPPNPRETVFMQILQMAVKIHGTTLGSTDFDFSCLFTDYVDFAGALRLSADRLEENAMLATLFGILFLVALIPTVMGAVRDSPPSALYQAGIVLSLSLSAVIYCMLVTQIPISTRELVDHVSASGIHSSCDLASATTTTTEHNLDAIDGTFYAATATAAVSVLLAAGLALSTSMSSNEDSGNMKLF